MVDDPWDHFITLNKRSPILERIGLRGKATSPRLEACRRQF
jgi:hypothetical protein